MLPASAWFRHTGHGVADFLWEIRRQLVGRGAAGLCVRELAEETGVAAKRLDSWPIPSLRAYSRK